ncbi:5-carboxymethyl-2-hydroxymuconate Delta-isomerase [Pseudomonas asplenii]|uniref:5-carboxymethyl-2-hydroxymuconate Delta-isomerase n=1 Tax=Pseudomonas asplenii TaxID=53407 RepID=UPI0006B40460|nr:5-carboxymethyl-2-hydroxymuconate Delta-isomerase [Pseudomonas fuscovaginae]KPA95290.1 5-carboxymethyl-2-hydroxymuconate isomerase [Pseudomonas fuscovaginae]
MPHVFLEYTSNLTDFEPDSALLRINHVLVASGQFAAESAIKSRATRVESFRVGTGLNVRGFVHVKLALLSGRSAQVKAQLSESLLAGLQELGNWSASVEVQLSVELVDLDRESYGEITL